MTREEWQRVKEVLHNALDVPRAERARLSGRNMQRQCGTARRSGIPAASHEDAGTFIEDPVAALPS